MVSSGSEAPITAVIVVADKARCPVDFTPVHTSHRTDPSPLCLYHMWPDTVDMHAA